MTNKKTQLVHDVIVKLEAFSRIYGISSIFIAGGYCRALLMKNMNDVKDIDVASAYPGEAIMLGGLFASEILHTTPRFYERTGTAAVTYKTDYGEILVEFQNMSNNAYMYNGDIRYWMRAEGIEDVPLMHNIYGRDFTINSLIYSLNDQEMYDPTGRGQKDFEDKRISPLLPAHLLVKYNPLSILRAIRFSLRYDFWIDKELKTAMRQGRHLLLRAFSKDRMLKEIVKILHIDSKQGLSELKRYGLDELVSTREIKDYLNALHGGK